MILKKAEAIKKVEEVNPYEWPESYYMETEPLKRKALLEERLAMQEEEGLNKLRLELWNLRYETMRNGKIRDRFIAGWMDLILMKDQAGGRFGKKSLRKQAMKALEFMGVFQVDYFGQELLLAELKHMSLLYCCSSMMDKQYGSILFGFGKMKKEKIDGKIMADLSSVGWEIPANLDLVSEFALVTEAINLTKIHMGYA